MRPGQAVATVLRRSFEFRGRSRRSEYWWWALFNILIQIAAETADSFLTVPAWNGTGLISLVALLMLTLPDMAVGWRRLQDTGLPGWIYAGFTIFSLLFLFLPEPNQQDLDVVIFFDTYTIVSLVLLGLMLVMIGLLVRNSKKGPNKYGPNPKGIGNVDVFN